VSGTANILIVTYRPDLGLRSCLESLRGQPWATVIVVVNNTAEVARSVADMTGSLSDMHVQIVPAGKNLGFAQGVNLGVRFCFEPYVFILNDDATLEPDALSVLISEMQRAAADVIGLAPKVLLDLPEPVIDNVGAAITSDGSVYNRGYNQKDVGQFNRQIEVAGACFAAVLLRREAFEPSSVGPLDGHYFMYAEDSDWCLRARLRGYRFVACPKAVVRHAHSLSSSTFPPEFKWRLIRRNSMLTIVKGFPPRLAARSVYWYLRESLRRAVRGGDGRAAIRDMVSLMGLVPWALWQRAAIRGLLKDNPADATLFDPHIAAQPDNAVAEHDNTS
jgi:GT2 family glycosyltransferase